MCIADSTNINVADYLLDFQEFRTNWLASHHSFGWMFTPSIIRNIHQLLAVNIRHAMLIESFYRIRVSIIAFSNLRRAIVLSGNFSRT